MTQDNKPKQSNAGGDAVANGPGINDSPPSKPAKELAEKFETMPALASLHEPDAPLLAAQLSAGCLPQGLDPGEAQLSKIAT
jgi:hypothetical protein